MREEIRVQGSVWQMNHGYESSEEPVEIQIYQPSLRQFVSAGLGWGLEQSYCCNL